MLFSPPNEFGNQFLYKVIAITTGVHGALLLLFFLCETWYGVQPLMFPLKGSGSPISLLSSKRGGPKGGMKAGQKGGQPGSLQGTVTDTKSPALPQEVVSQAKKEEVVAQPLEKSVAEKIATPVPKPQVKPEPEAKPKLQKTKQETKKEKASKKEAKTETKKKSQKGESKKGAAKPLSKDISKTKSKKELAQEDKVKKEKAKEKEKIEEAKKARTLKVESKKAQSEKGEPERARLNTQAEGNKVSSALATKTLQESTFEELQQGQEGGPAAVEFDVGDGGGSEDLVGREIKRHFTLPPGFDDIEPFLVTFTIEKGRATTISPHGRESLVVYTAFKDALLKSEMPTIKGKRTITMLIT